MVPAWGPVLRLALRASGTRGRPNWRRRRTASGWVTRRHRGPRDARRDHQQRKPSRCTEPTQPRSTSGGDIRRTSRQPPQLVQAEPKHRALNSPCLGAREVAALKRDDWRERICVQGAGDGGRGHAATPDRARKSDCQARYGTAPLVSASMALAVSASGKRLPLRYRLIAACERPTFAASASSAFSAFER